MMSALARRPFVAWLFVVLRTMALLALGGLQMAAHAARPEVDALTADSLDTCRWFDWSQNARISHENALVLKTDSSQAYSNGWVVSQYAVGDVVAEVDIDVRQGFESAVPDAAQLYAGLGLFVDNGNYLLIALARVNGSIVVRAVRAKTSDGPVSFENAPLVVIAATATRLRVTRSGSQVTVAFGNTADWITAATFSDFAEPAYVTMQASSIGIQRVLEARFKNFTLSEASNTTFRPYVAGGLYARADFMAGGVVTDYIYQREWGGQWRQRDLMQTLAANGMRWIRTGVTTLSVPSLRSTPVAQWGTLTWSTEFWSSQEAAGQVLKEASAQGLGNVLFFYLSDTAAHAGMQDAPAEWRGLSVQETAVRLREYTARVVGEYRSQGIRIGLYEVGNEIDFGILNFRIGERIATPPDGIDVLQDVPRMRRLVWRDEATLLKAAIEGIRQADPGARIGLHAALIGKSPSDLIVKAFFRTMIDEGVPFDVAGLSVYVNDSRGTSNCWFQRLQETVDTLGKMGKQVLISEAVYPNDPRGASLISDGSGGGGLAALADFGFTPQGQAAWVREMLRFGNNHPYAAGFMYFYPEWKPGASADPQTVPTQYIGLFDANEFPLPALSVFKIPPLGSDFDCLFRWTEHKYAQFLVPANVSTVVDAPFTYRHYPSTSAYLGVSSTDQHLYYLGPASSNELLDLGSVSTWLMDSGC